MLVLVVTSSRRVPIQGHTYASSITEQKPNQNFPDSIPVLEIGKSSPISSKLTGWRAARKLNAGKTQDLNRVGSAAAADN
jgi:hypothetical protein